MTKIKFLKTNDTSTGLYSEEDNDIFHSKTGAKSEAFDKFIFPSNIKELLKSKKKIKVLDICYGIGYNTKALLSLINDERILIDCLELNKDLAFISAFINDAFEDETISLFIIEELLRNGFEIDEILLAISCYLNQNTQCFFRDATRSFKVDKILKGDICHIQDKNNALLHNIYYHYISNKLKYKDKLNKYNKVKIDFFFDDARNIISNLNQVYDVVFLDAFSPQKNPTLWTIDFLSRVKSKMHDDSIFVTYSKSTPVRSALCELGFYVGKTFINNIDMGTVASLNINNINFPLDDYDMELIKTRAGIYYEDYNLNLPPESILFNRDLEMKNSDRISHTQFLKKYKK